MHLTTMNSYIIINDKNKYIVVIIIYLLYML